MFVGLLCAWALGSAPQQPSPSGEDLLRKLEPTLDRKAQRFRGRLGYCVIDLRSGSSISHRGDERFPAASTIKTVLMIEAIRQIEEGKLRWTDKVPLPPVNQRQRSLWAYHLREGANLDIDGLVNLSMTVSDNTTSVMLGRLLGPNQIEQRMMGWGFPNTKWLSEPPADNLRLVRLRRTFANMGMTTPVEMARLLEKLYRGQLASPAATDRMVRIMSRQYWDDWITGMIPKDVVVAGKVGALNRSRSDTAIVFGPRPYVLTIYTDHQTDRRWTVDNEGNLAIRAISSAVWNGMNPERPYQSPSGAEDWLPTGAGID